MSQGTTGAVLAHDKIDRYRPLGAFGRPAYQSHVQLRAMLLAKRGARFADYFAKPTYDADTGELRWTAEVPGEARGWHTMSPEEQAKRALDLEVIRSGLASYAQELRAQGGDAQTGGAQAFASLLEQALRVPAQGDFLYFVGDQPVIAFWGFETQAGSSVEPAAVAPQYPPRGFAPAATPAAVPPAEAKRKRPWWWWLLWGLLALLLLLALLWLLRACAPVPPIDEPRPPVEEPQPPAEEPKPPLEEPPPAEEPKPVEEPPEEPKPKPKPPPKDGAPQTKGLKPGKELQIPKGALEKGDLSFLEGLWQLGEGRLQEYRGRPDNVVATNRSVFQFGRGGGGTASQVERSDSRTGQPLPSKSERLRARTDGRRLYIKSEGGAKYECEIAPSGKTHCYVVNPDGHRWNAPLRRLR